MIREERVYIGRAIEVVIGKRQGPRTDVEHVENIPQVAGEKSRTTPTFVEYDGDPWAYAWDANGNRRDLSQDQRYLL